MTNKTRCGFIAALGAPNAGKSTLTNALVGEKVSIVSPKVQTTRTRVLGIYMDGPAQVLLVDTPGIFDPQKRMDRAMVAAAWNGAKDSDLSMLLIDASRSKAFEEAKAIIDVLVEKKRKVILVLNKIDLIKRDTLLSLSERLNDIGEFEATFMVSAKTGNGVEELKSYLSEIVPESPWLYPEDQASDMPSRLLAAEITREKLFIQLHQELPYATTVETEEWEQFDNGSIRIAQVIFVQRDTQRAIVLGKGGAKIKRIGQDSRRELKEIFGTDVHLKLFVKVRENWQDDPSRYSVWGLDFNA